MNNAPQKRLTFRLPRSMVQQLDAIVAAGVYRTRTDAIFHILQEFLVSKQREAV